MRHLKNVVNFKEIYTFKSYEVFINNHGEFTVILL